jgi:SAM-dependent methyltransferase
MSGFSAEWLALREPVDGASRNAELTARLIDWRCSIKTPSPFVGEGKAGGDQQLSVLDLGSGTGANFRFLAPLLGGNQRWRLVDHDPDLLRRNNDVFNRCAVERHCLGLVGDWGLLDFQDVQLVTASALIDLVSAEWLERLARRCREVQAAVFIVLTYDGTIVWEPALPGDETVCEWVNRHQRTDKGFGPALGPLATPTLKAWLEHLGYRVDLRSSPWRLEPEQATMQTALLEGWMAAVREMAPDAAGWLDEWAIQRRRLIEPGHSRLRVGHWDLFADGSPI